MERPKLPPSTQVRKETFPAHPEKPPRWWAGFCHRHGDDKGFDTYEEAVGFLWTKFESVQLGGEWVKWADSETARADAAIAEHQTLREAGRLAIAGFIRAREFMGLQLTLAHDGCSQQAFDNEAKDHFARPRMSDEYAQRLIPIVLFGFGQAIDAETFSEIFHCDMDVAERVILGLVRQAEAEAKAHAVEDPEI